MKILFLMALLYSCKEVGTKEGELFRSQPLTSTSEIVTFEEIKQEILRPFKCAVCHARWATSETGIQKYIVEGDPDKSPLFLRIEDESMPLGGPVVDRRRRLLLRSYIKQVTQ